MPSPPVIDMAIESGPWLLDSSRFVAASTIEDSVLVLELVYHICCPLGFALSSRTALLFIAGEGLPDMLNKNVTLRRDRSPLIIAIGRSIPRHFETVA